MIFLIAGAICTVLGTVMVLKKQLMIRDIFPFIVLELFPD